jgi:two-component system nitrogen regulation response regulator GlnG
MSIELKEKVIEIEEALLKEKKGFVYRAILDIIEKPLFEYALERTFGNQLKAARILGINRNTMRVKIKKLGINPEQYK